MYIVFINLEKGRTFYFTQLGRNLGGIIFYGNLQFCMSETYKRDLTYVQDMAVACCEVLSCEQRPFDLPS